jgi:hypothetical protein
MLQEKIVWELTGQWSAVLLDVQRFRIVETTPFTVYSALS